LTNFTKNSKKRYVFGTIIRLQENPVPPTRPCQLQHFAPLPKRVRSVITVKLFTMVAIKQELPTWGTHTTGCARRSAGGTRITSIFWTKLDSQLSSLRIGPCF